MKGFCEIYAFTMLATTVAVPSSVHAQIRELEGHPRSLEAFVDMCHATCAGDAGSDCSILGDLDRVPTQSNFLREQLKGDSKDHHRPREVRESSSAADAVSND